ncbi:hypothetical protein ABT390_28075 [Streptomyces aurantiacus]|uniref:Uncharacterized protein n=1 Tax=Streptomyces aurantiacus JA 4570 TaxID=1286094 RepID=S3ZF86_9ACTN|nr:hypothetical protein [Streptomyces aurantiacus]EPH41309.1 hypothetical protein STRAU_5545 [Streptomyces aurantiacus JA 4570]
MVSSAGSGPGEAAAHLAGVETVGGGQQPEPSLRTIRHYEETGLVIPVE